MKIVCAWCNKNMGEKNGRGVEGVTHGMCKQCLAKFMAKVESNISARDEQDERVKPRISKDAPPSAIFSYFPDNETELKTVPGEEW